ncbi:MAG TPA: carbonic anhydrase [Verrucomicrobiae bacterium]|jgi:carbonic anhydrase|nr:carbonic anhydrase [Verrucomicrobiae bacterium]
MKNSSTSDSALSRRRLLQLGITGTAAGLMGGAFPLVLPTPAEAQDVSTPDAALAELMNGNKRYVSNTLTSPQHDLDLLKQNTEEKQEPFAAVLSCADSRVPVEWVFDQTIGHIFVARVAGNLITPEIIGSLEYGAAVLGTKVILVLGHAGCGAVAAAIQGKSVPGQISSLFPHIQPAIDQAGPDLTATIKANAQYQAKLLRESSTVLAPMAKQGKVKVVSAYYDLARGAVTLLE